MSTKDTIVLIDSHALIHRAYHAIPPRLSTKGGVQVNAVYGYTRILLEVLEKFKPKYVVCAFDSKGPTFRHDMYPDYKGTRKKPDQELIDQIPIVKSIVQSFNIPLIEKSGYEADDILGTLASHSETQSLDKIIVTGDQDLFQTINDSTSVYIAGGFGKSVLYTKENINEKLGFGPEYLIDYKAIKGDASDNIPGVKGIGEKGATELIQQFGHLENILENIEQISSKIAGKLKSDTQSAVLSKKLATIFTKVPIKFILGDAIVQEYNKHIVLEKFQELGFSSLISKMPAVAESIEVEDGQFGFDMGINKVVEKTSTQFTPNPNYQLVNSSEQLDELIPKIERSEFLAFDTETTGANFMDMKVLGISIAIDDLNAWYINLNSEWFGEKEKSKLQNIFENKKIKKIGHNLKFDIHALKNSTTKGVSLGYIVGGIHFDTMISAYLIYGGEVSLGLKPLGFNEFGVQMRTLDSLWEDGDKRDIELKMLDIPIEYLTEYACDDAHITFRLFQKYSIEFKEKINFGIKKLFDEIEIPLIPILCNMERNGIELDVHYLEQYGREMSEEIAKVSMDIYKLAGRNFNIDSPKQVGEVLFDEFKFEGGKKTKTGAWQTNEQVLFDLVGSHEIIDLILRYRELSKLRSTYVESLVSQVNSGTGRIHSSFNQTIAQTGRLSSSNPNLQNIPVATIDGQKIRRSFVASSNGQYGRTLISFDISQQELRILAHMSGEEELIKAFREDVDVHALTASMVFGKDIGEITKEERNKGKTLNFSLMYGISEFGLAKRLKIGREEAKKLIDDYFKSYSNIHKFYDELVAGATKNHRVETMFGRWRDTKGLLSKNFKIRNATYREVINFPIQGSAADMIKISMIEADKYIQSSKVAKSLNAKLILQIHDELIYEVDNRSELIEEFGQEIIKIMENSVKLNVPIKVGMKTAKSWDELK